jgi:hypothetical protein
MNLYKFCFWSILCILKLYSYINKIYNIVYTFCSQSARIVCILITKWNTIQYVRQESPNLSCPISYLFHTWQSCFVFVALRCKSKHSWHCWWLQRFTFLDRFKQLIRFKQSGAKFALQTYVFARSRGFSRRKLRNQTLLSSPVGNLWYLISVPLVFRLPFLRHFLLYNF